MKPRAMRKRFGVRALMVAVAVVALILIPVRLYLQYREFNRLKAELARAVLQREVAQVAEVEYSEGIEKQRRSGRLSVVRILADEETIEELREEIAVRRRDEAALRTELERWKVAHPWF